MDTEKDYVDYSETVVYRSQPMRHIEDTGNDADDTDNNSDISPKTIMSEFTSEEESDSDTITDIPPQFRTSIWGAGQQACYEANRRQLLAGGKPDECAKPSAPELRSEIDALINESFITRSQQLIIISVHLDSLPDVLNQMDWIKTLTVINCGLSELKNIPPKLEVFKCKRNNIPILDGKMLPTTIKELEFEDNKTEVAINLHNGLLYISLADNKLKELETPPSVTKINLKGNQFEKEPVLNDGILEIQLSNNPLTSVDAIQKSVMVLDVCRTKLTEINSFPPSIMTFKAYLCNIVKITAPFPESIEELDLYKNNLEDIPELPPRLTTADLSGNKLKVLKNIPDTVRHLDITDMKTLVLTDEQKTKLKSMKASNGTVINWNEKDDDDDDGIFNIFDADTVYSNYTGSTTRFNPNFSSEFSTGRTFPHIPYGGYGHFGGKYTKHNPNYIIPKKTFGI
jgi:hypothetical protein